MKKIIKNLSLLCTLLMLSMLVTPETASALAESEGDTNTLIFNEQGLAALDKSVYVDLTTNSAHVDILQIIS